MQSDSENAVKAFKNAVGKMPGEEIYPKSLRKDTASQMEDSKRLERQSEDVSKR